MFLLALEANAGNLTRTSRETGVPVTTLKHWRDGEGVTPDVPVLVAEKKEPLADVFERVARIYLDHAESDTVVAKTPGQASVIAAAAATDKSLLLRGQATSITAAETPQIVVDRVKTAILRDMPEVDPVLVERIAQEEFERMEAGQAG